MCPSAAVYVGTERIAGRDGRTRTTDGERESYTFTCEKDGEVLQQQQLFIGRGDRVRLDLSECRRKA